MSGEKVITATIEDKFEVEKFWSFGRDDNYVGVDREVVHQGVKLTFSLLLKPKQTGHGGKNFIGVFLKYEDGPQEKIKLNRYLFAVRDSTDKPCKSIGKMMYFDSYDEYTRNGVGFGWADVLPRSMSQLKSQSWLRSENSVLHVIAMLLIPESAFDDPENKYQVTPISNPYFKSLFSQINTPVDTSSPYKFNRFDFISSDDFHFYVHKDVLSFSSDAFKQMFDYDKPQDAQFDYIKKGFMKMEKLNALALNQIFTYIYLGHITSDLKNNCALQVLDAANMYGLHGLFLLCEQKLIAEAKRNRDIPSLLRRLEASIAHQLPELTEACVRCLETIMSGQKDLSEDVLLSIIQRANQHELTELRDICEKKFIEHVQLTSSELTATNRVLHFLSIAETNDLKNLLDECSEWFRKNWDKLTENGLGELMKEDEANSLLLRMMGRVLSKNAQK